MKHIIFPTDFSATSSNALVYAKSLAQIYGATIHVVHTYRLSIASGYDVIPATDTTLIDEIYADALKQVKLITDGLLQENVQAKGHVTMGFLIEIINSIAEDLEDSLIVCGTTGASNVVTRFLGSNAAAIIERASAPVLIIPASAGYKEFKNIVFASPLQAKNLKQMEYVMDIANKYNSNVNLLKIDIDGEFHVVDEKEIQHEIKAHFADKRLPVLHIHSDSVKNGLLYFTNKFQPDLLVMVTVTRSFIDQIFDPSYTRSLAMSTEIPLLVLHRTHIAEPASNGQNYATIQA